MFGKRFQNKRCADILDIECLCAQCPSWTLAGCPYWTSFSFFLFRKVHLVLHDLLYQLELFAVSAVCPLLWFNLKVLSLLSFLYTTKWVQYVRQKEDIQYDNSSSSSVYNTDWNLLGKLSCHFFRSSSPGHSKLSLFLLSGWSCTVDV